jgi:hypothetical protein
VSLKALELVHKGPRQNLFLLSTTNLTCTRKTKSEIATIAFNYFKRMLTHMSDHAEWGRNSGFIPGINFLCDLGSPILFLGRHWGLNAGLHAS